MDLHSISCFSGVGMLDEGLRAGLRYMGIALRTICHVEREAYSASVLAARMEEKSMDAAPIWSDILAEQPWYRPALSIEGEHDAAAAFAATQPVFRGMADGLAAGLDFGSRAPRLKCVGNGVVALCAATAFVVLARRAGIFGGMKS